MRRPKRPGLPGEPPQWFKDRVNQMELARQAMRAERDSWLPPDGTPAPSPQAAALDRHMAAMRAAADRAHWMSGHKAWMADNGLTCTDDELSQWYDHPDRDRLPMPGILQWQARIAANYSSHSYGDPQPVPLDYTAARQIQACQQEISALRAARQDDAAHLAWAEGEANRLQEELAAMTGERDKLAARHDQACQREADLTAALRKQENDHAQLTEKSGQQQAVIDRYRASTAKLEAQVTDAKTAAGELKEQVSQLELANRNLTYKVQHKESVIAQLEAEARQAADDAAGTGHALAAHEQVIGWQKEKLSGLEAENRELAALTGQLQARIDRLTRPPERRRRQLPAATGADQAGAGQTGAGHG